MWIDNDRELKRAYMCSHQVSYSFHLECRVKSLKSANTEINEGNGDCPTGWLKLRHYCYQLNMSTDPLPFDQVTFIFLPDLTF